MLQDQGQEGAPGVQKQWEEAHIVYTSGLTIATAQEPVFKKGSSEDVDVKDSVLGLKGEIPKPEKHNGLGNGSGRVDNRKRRIKGSDEILSLKITHKK